MSESEITSLEHELRIAQLNADVDALDRLISEDLLFTGPDGTLATKADDLGAYSSGALRITTQEPEELRVRRVGDDAYMVAVRTQLAGTLAGTPFSGVAAYTRVWAREHGRWLIAGGHVSIFPSDAA